MDGVSWSRFSSGNWTTSIEQNVDIMDNDTIHSGSNLVNTTQPQDSHSSGTTYHCHLYRFIMSVGITGSLCIFGIVGNILTLLVFHKYNTGSVDTKSKSSAPLLLSGLAVSDFSLLFTLYIVKCVPSFVSFTKMYPKFFVTYTFLFLMVYGWPCVGVSQSINSWITVLVALHRFIAIMYPHKAAIHCTYREARIHLVVVSFIVTIYELPTFFNNKISHYKTQDDLTVYFPMYREFNVNHWYKLIYKTTLYYIINYLIPWMILAIVTVFLIRAVKKAQKFRSQMGANNPGHHDSTDDITKSLIAIVVTSLVCRPWEPIRRVIEAIVGRKPGCGHYYYYYEELPSLTASVNSSANFIIYCLFSKRFPDTLKEMFKLKNAQRYVERTVSTAFSDTVTDTKNHQNAIGLKDKS